MNDTIAYTTIADILRKNGGEHKGLIFGKEVWKINNRVQSFLPKERIDIEVFIDICNGLGISTWEVDSHLN